MTTAESEVVVLRPGRYRIELHIMPYADGGADIKLYRIGPRGGKTLLRYVGGPASAKTTRREILDRHRHELSFLRTVAQFYPKER